MILIVIIYLIFLITFLISINYEKQFKQSLNKKEHPLIILYPMALFIAHFFDREGSESHRKRMEQIRLLHANEDITVQYKIFMAKKYATVFFCILMINIIATFMALSGGKEPEVTDGAIQRPSYGEDAKDVDLNVVINKDGEQVEQQITIQVDPKEYTQETFDEAADAAEEYLDKAVLGENISLDKIYYSLNLVSSIPNTALKVGWDLDSLDLIKSDGSLNQEGLEEEKEVTITATITSGSFEREHTISLIILPENLSEEDKLLYQLNDLMDQANEGTSTEDSLVLPETVDDYTVSYEEPSENNVLSFVLFGGLICILLFLVMERQLTNEKEERDIQIMLDYPELINKFTLLIGAGMTVKKAWEKIVMEYDERRKSNKTEKRYAYEELKVTLFQLNNGMNESQAYEAFGRRMQLVPYMKFSALLAQNISKGMDGILKSLEYEAIGAFEERKELAKRLGEKAGTKLLLPMGIMLCLVFVMILIPAFASF